MKIKFYIIIFCFLVTEIPLSGQSFTEGDNDARLFGIHEITLTGINLPPEAQRYSKYPCVRFLNDGRTVNVKAFYDGNGNGEEGSLWKARLYVTEAGIWSWSVTDNGGIELLRPVKGSFCSFDTNFSLKGKLRRHLHNPNRWATEREPETAFVILGDTYYTLMDKIWTKEGDPDKGGAGDWDAVIDDSHEKGVTLIRAGAFGGYSGWNGTQTVGSKNYPRPNWPWADQDAEGNKDVYDLLQLAETDKRLKYSFDKYEDLYFELIISPKVKMWGSYWNHNTYGCSVGQVENFRKYMTARFSAWPNVIFQLVYDIDFEEAGGGCGADPRGYGEANYAFAQNWLEWLNKNDPFNTMRCIGNGNDYDDPFPAAYYNTEDPAPTYLHDEAIGDISGKTAEKYYGINKIPIFHGEDTYEVDVSWGAGTDPSENDPEYYYRRLFWTDLLSGAYPCYGGGYKAIIPYNKAYDKVNYFSEQGVFKIKLRGLDDIIHIKNFFQDNKLDLAGFHPADSLAINGPPDPVHIQVAHNKEKDEFIIYHPNANAGETSFDPNNLCDEYSEELASVFSCSVDNNSIPAVTINLHNDQTYIPVWFDPSTGKYFHVNEIVGTGSDYSFIAPQSFKGRDAVLYIRKKPAGSDVVIIGHRGGRDWAPENTIAAFKKCADNNIDWETDLNLTADGEIILMHDMTLDRTTNAEEVFGSLNIPVNSKILEEIKMLDAGSHYGSEYAGEKVPTLDEFLDFFIARAPENSVISMDTKLDRLSPGPAVYQKIIDKIASRNLFNRVYIEVFSIEAVNKTRSLPLGDKLKYAIWVNRDTTLLKDAISSGYFSRIHASNILAGKADKVHEGGVPFISAHPVEKSSEWDLVKNYNINGVSTDRPDVALFIIRQEIPECRIKEPADKSVFKEGAGANIIVGVDDTDSSVTKVEFYINDKLTGSDSTPPYSYWWSEMKTGCYSLSGKVFDNGLNKKAEPVIVHVE